MASNRPASQASAVPECLQLMFLITRQPSLLSWDMSCYPFSLVRVRHDVKAIQTTGQPQKRAVALCRTANNWRKADKRLNSGLRCVAMRAAKRVAKRLCDQTSLPLPVSAWQDNSCMAPKSGYGFHCAIERHASRKHHLKNVRK